MTLKRKLVSSTPSSLAQTACNHPSLKQVKTANSSSTREHTESYHDILEKFDIRKEVNAPLLAWYGSRGDLPWRSDLSDEQLQSLTEEAKAQRAYEVWVSEIMLQQTQVATVIPYYQKWMAAFPTVKTLAQASIDSVNSLWKGLGYYSRASRLLDGAKTVVNDYNSKLPSDPEVLVKKIEGIGPYTAGAIASIAYGVQTPTVDGNIQRVICRLLAIYADMKKKSTTDYIWAAAEKMVPSKRAGHWNQALMDLGATICTPKNPKCGECPMNNVCLAYAEVKVAKLGTTAAIDIEDTPSSPPPMNNKEGKGKATACTLCLLPDPPSLDREVTLYPLKVVKKKSRDEDIAVCVVEWRSTQPDEEASRVLLVKRPKTGLLAGLDEFPSVVMPESDSTPSARLSTSVELLNELLILPPELCIKTIKDYTSLSVSASQDLGSIKHIYSHINATFHCRHLVVTTGSGVPPKVRKENNERCRWVAKDEVDQANISTGAVKIWKLVTDGPVPLKTAVRKKTAVVTKAIATSESQTKLSFKKKVVAVDVHTNEPEIQIVSPRKKRRIEISSDEEE